jgi:8-oxo-dGTP diphosphatase
MIQATLCFLFRDEPPPAILLGYKKRGFGQGNYGGFGGQLRDGEILVQAALRELYKESGLSVEPLDLAPLGHLTFIFPYKPAWSQVVHLFIAKNWLGTPIESDEMRPEWFDLTSLPLDQMWNDTRYWMPHILLRHPVDPIFILKQDNETVNGYSFRLL